MADPNAISAWLDAPDDTAKPNFSDQKAAGDWLDAPSNNQLNLADPKHAEAFLDAPDEQPSFARKAFDTVTDVMLGPQQMIPRFIREFKGEPEPPASDFMAHPIENIYETMVPFSGTNRQNRADLEAQVAQMMPEWQAAREDPAKMAAFTQKWGALTDERNPLNQLNNFMYSGVGPSAEAANEIRKPVPEPAPAPEAAPRAAEPPPQPAPEPPAAAQGAVFGFKNDDGSVSRGIIEGIDNGVVAWKTEDGTTHLNHVDDLTPRMAPPPEPTAMRDNATTVPAPEVEQPAAPTPAAADINEFNPWEEGPAPPPREPAPPSPQQAMELPDTTQGDMALRAARTLRVNAAEAQRLADAGVQGAKSADEISLMHRQAEALEQEALAKQRATAAKPTGQPENLPPIDTTRETMGPLGRNQPAESEATTGTSLTEPGSPAKRSEIEAAQKQAPLLTQEPAPGAELPPPDTGRGRMGELGVNAPVVSEASTGAPPATPVSPAKRPPAPMDILQAIAHAGGIQDETAMRFGNTKAGRAAKRGGELDFLYEYPTKGARKAASVVVPGEGVRSVINNKNGRSGDYMREYLTERGYLPEGATVQDMHDLMRRTKAGDRQYSIHGPNSEINEVMQHQAEQRAVDEADMAHYYGSHEQEVRDSLVSPDTWFGPEPTHADVEALDALISPEMMDALRLDEHEPLMGRLDEALPSDIINEVRGDAHEGDFTQGSAAEGHPPAERLPSGEPESAPITREPGNREEGSGVPAAPERGPGEAPVTERTPQGEQVVMPGMERSARQAAESRPERLRAEAEQKPADEGLFARPEAEQLDIEKESGYPRGVKLSAGFDPFEIYGRVKDAVKRVGEAIRTSAKDRGTAADVIKAATGNAPPGLLKRTALKAAAQAGRYLSFASTVASRDPTFARYYAQDLMRERYREALERDGGSALTKYEALTQAGRDNVNKVLEHDRLTGYDRRNFGARAVAKMPDEYAGQLAKPGETVVLSPEETAALKDLRGFFDTRLTDIGRAMASRFGYKGEFAPEAMQAEAAGAETARGKTAAARALDVYNMIQDARRKGYVPLQRYGNHWIRVSTKPGYEVGKDGLQPGHTVQYEFMDTGAPQSDAFVTGGKEASQQTVEQRIAELRKQFPADKFDITHAPVTPDSMAKLDIPAMEKLFSILSQKDPHLSDALYDNVMRQVYEEAKSGFRKQANNVAGYSPDFERAVADYVRQSSRVVSDMEMGKGVDEAYAATQQHPDPLLRDYAEAYKNHLDKGKNDFFHLRKIGFFGNLWGSVKAAATNLTQTPLVTTSQLATWAGARAPLAAHQALVEVLGVPLVHRGALSVTPRGLEIDWNRLGRTPEEKAMIAQLRKEGVLDPVVSKDLQGADASKNPDFRGIAKGAKGVYDAGASAFNVSEQANRIAAALSAFRMARMPELFERMKKVYAKDHLFQEMVGPRGTPTDAARFMVDETQFMGGKRGRPPIMRGFGSIAFQFKQYPANYFRLMNKNLNRMGASGKMAATMMLGALGLGAGVEGEPFVQDIIKGYDWAMKMAKGVDPVIEYKFAQVLHHMGISPEAADMLLHGVTRATPVDMSQSIGMGNIAPDDTSILSSIPLLSATVGKAGEAWQRYRANQPIGAAATVAQMALGRGPADLIKGLGQLPNEGYSTQYGKPVIFPSQITGGEMAAKALGFQPTKFAQESEYQATDKRIHDATQQASSELLTNIARNIAMADDARKQGRLELARSYDADNDQLFRQNAQQLGDAGIPDWQKVPAPQRAAIRQKALGMINYQLGQLKTAGKMKRGAMEDYPLPH